MSRVTGERLPFGGAWIRRSSGEGAAMAFRKSPRWAKEREEFLNAAAEAFEAMDAERPADVFETFEQRESRAVALGMTVARALLQRGLDVEEEASDAALRVPCPDCHHLCDVVPSAKGILRDRTIVTHAGDVMLKRAMYYCQPCRRSFFPAGHPSRARG